jgi:hypothetical protein
VGARAACVAACLALGISADAAGQANRRIFTEGTYRQNGTCAKLVWSGKDLTAQCEPFFLVVARQRDLPRFTFMLGASRSYIFLASRSAEFLDDGRTISYAVARVVDLEARRQRDVVGECRLVVGERNHEAHCIAWQDASRTQLAAEARFLGDGTWHQQLLEPLQ